MAKIILIYADCMNITAKGDYALAGSLAKDLTDELEKYGSDIKVVLTSRLEGLVKYHSLYGQSVNNMLTIDGTNIRLIAIDCIDGVNDHVVAFIQANRCKYAPAELVKHVLSPDSKLLFVGAANQPTYGTNSTKQAYISGADQTQPGIYPYFDKDDIQVVPCGFGVNRLGLPLLKSTTELPVLDVKERIKIPSRPYGFMYIANFGNNAKELITTISQYIQLTGYEEYELVGNFTDMLQTITSGVAQDLRFNGQDMHSASSPAIMYQGSLDALTMRHMVAQSQKLVLSTGVMSVVEAMQDGKLPFYQFLEHNKCFVKAYLKAVELMCASDKTLFAHLPDMIIKMSELLFAPKPLSPAHKHELKELLAIEAVSDHLVEINKRVIAVENGRVARQLLSFIGNPQHTSVHHQCIAACMFLRKPGEHSMPLYDVALRRAASWGCLFELKVLLRSMTRAEGSRQDSTHQRSALHWAVIGKQLDCARLLIKHGVDLDARDVDGRTPLHRAVFDKNREMIKLLVSAGASLSIEDKMHITPCNAIDDSLRTFIHACSYQVGVMAS